MLEDYNMSAHIQNSNPSLPLCTSTVLLLLLVKRKQWCNLSHYLTQATGAPKNNKCSEPVKDKVSSVKGQIATQDLAMGQLTQHSCWGDILAINVS